MDSLLITEDVLETLAVLSPMDRIAVFSIVSPTGEPRR
jgi:hypothetical protein